MAKDVEKGDKTIADVEGLAPAVDSAGKLRQLAEERVLVPVEDVKLGIQESRCGPSVAKTLKRQNTRTAPASE